MRAGIVRRFGRQPRGEEWRCSDERTAASRPASARAAPSSDRSRNLPLLRDPDLPPLGGDGRRRPLLTTTLLINAFTAGGRDGGPRLVAYDKATGEIVGSVDLPGGALGTPMTYMPDGRQYIALTVGGRVPELIAFRLPS